MENETKKINGLLNELNNTIQTITAAIELGINTKYYNGQLSMANAIKESILELKKVKLEIKIFKGILDEPQKRWVSIESLKKFIDSHKTEPGDTTKEFQELERELR